MELVGLAGGRPAPAEVDRLVVETVAVDTAVVAVEGAAGAGYSQRSDAKKALH